MKVFIVECEKSHHELFYVDVIIEKKGILFLLKDRQIIGQFKNWNCWYEKVNQEKKED